MYFSKWIIYVCQTNIVCLKSTDDNAEYILFDIDYPLNWRTCTNLSLIFILKPMDSFGKWRKWYFLLMQNFIGLYELLMPC